MNSIGTFIFLCLFLVVGIIIYYNAQENKRNRKKNEEEKQRLLEIERQKLYDFFKTNLEGIKSANQIFYQLLDLKTGYFTHYQWTVWATKTLSKFNEIKGSRYDNIGLSNEEVLIIKNFYNYCTDGSIMRDEFNQRFVKEELKNYSTFFDTIEGRKLDLQQRTSVVTDEQSNIVIAGAGSGKTTTIVGKVNYIIDRYKIKPEEILLISFTNKSASTLAGRINIEGVEAKTFHKFGKDIIVTCEGQQPSIFDEAQFKPLITKYFKELIANSDYLEKVTRYFLDFLKPSKSQFEFENKGDYIQYLKDQNFQSYKLIEVTAKGKITFKMEVVKSIEECKIANFLLFNGIDYEYEYPYEHNTANEKFRQYKPDFTITQNGKKVYLEHFGISRNGSVPKWFEGDMNRTPTQKYQDDMKWKQELHQKNNTILIESYSYEMSENILYRNLKANLEAVGIILKPRPSEEIWNIITQAANDEVNSFITLFGTFITLLKSNNYSITSLLAKNNSEKAPFFRDRNKLFIEIIEPIFKRYESYLKDRNEIDFNDMINKASGYISNGAFNKKYSYVIIDEFQDISIGRYQLVKAIKKNNPYCKLFCVGDDWQSIYRFTGSDIALFKEFEKYFGFTVKSKIETTYRFNNPLIGISSDFIQKNPNQTQKKLNPGGGTQSTNYKIHYSNSGYQDDTEAILGIFTQLLIVDESIAEKEILILGRYSFDINRIKNENGLLKIDSTNAKITYSTLIDTGVTRKLEAQFMTVHKSKGLEADIIIVLNCNSGKFGFPSEMSDDPVLNLLLSNADQFENGEERRLFYVAMTRAKDQVYFVADSYNKSKFITELEVKTGLSPNKKCPNCKTADIVVRKTGTASNGNTYKFFGCSNYLYGCDYTTTEWTNYNKLYL
ncbi:DNA helicase-4 [Flavobacterium sp. 9]|uniref:UvrD-helicase domain-containing protein n=1 Tax=Flavobacterium sp. 9 TaxID=2035198 RepID=UPI000C19AEA6|nr:UvrD-helicase domain-containing protein [Flavobacterium sp. 9]PIF34519.1 DNA helicase-4 [Flavobacterium sp. 9]